MDSRERRVESWLGREVWGFGPGEALDWKYPRMLRSGPRAEMGRNPSSEGESRGHVQGPEETAEQAMAVLGTLSMSSRPEGWAASSMPGFARAISDRLHPERQRSHIHLLLPQRSAAGAGSATDRTQ
jgi:hypothetical protein